jgi:hypothetical protein
VGSRIDDKRVVGGMTPEVRYEGIALDELSDLFGENFEKLFIGDRCEVFSLTGELS